MKRSLSYFIFLCVLAAASCQFSDGIQNFDDNCDGENKFQCLSGICIDSDKWCDANSDCDDGSDEFFCTTQALDDLLCNMTHQYMCQDKSRCIRHDWLCNNVTDCHDGSDEANCTLEQIANATSCKGFRCTDGTCISLLWACDGLDDCTDGGDETEAVCRKYRYFANLLEDEWCAESVIHVNYRCVDAKYCVPEDMMCNGLDDCRDGSDEGLFCKNWATMCTNSSCKDKATCYPDRSGPLCKCRPHTKYNYTTLTCEDINYCLVARPVCSQHCENRKHGKYMCTCEEGYTSNATGCFATGPEALLFVTTPKEIKYFTLKSHQTFIVATDVKKAHGVTYDGSYVYWVETMEGHQAVSRAHLDDIAGTREVLLALGLEDPGGIAVDHLGGNFYLTDSEKGVIIVCKTNGNICAVVKTKTKHPRFVTLDPGNGMMYWSDLHGSPVIMEARMDGSKSRILVNTMKSYASGLALDSPNERLYYVDDMIRVVRLDDGKVHTLMEHPSTHPYGVAVFENSVYWSDWTTNMIMRSKKLGFPKTATKQLIKMDSHVTGIHIYHELLARPSPNPCAGARCSHFCFVTSQSTHQCGCPTGYQLVNDSCQALPHYHPEYLIVSSGNNFTRVQLDVFSNPQTHTTSFNIGYVQAMAMDRTDTLYIFDGQHKSINYIKMEDFTLGITHVLLSSGLDYIADMDYDYSTHCLYWVDSGSRSIEVFSLQSRQRAILYRFTDGETPISLSVMVEYGKMMVAVLENDLNDVVHIDSIGLDGSDRKHVIRNNLKGPLVMLRLSHTTGNVYIADEGDRIIDFVHPEGTKREKYLYLPEPVTSLALAGSVVFWSGRGNRLFWSDVHEVYPKTRRMELNLFPPTAALHLTATLPAPPPSSPYLSHPCLTSPPCSHICIQSPHSPSLTNTHTLPYVCLCPPNMKLVQNECVLRRECKENELYCLSSNECFPESGRCDGENDCMHGEDEQDCKKNETVVCGVREMLCDRVCIDEHQGCASQDNTTEEFNCNELEFKCPNESLCLDQSQRCDLRADCADGSDEISCIAHFCASTGSFTCLSGDCIMDKWRCDGEEDCTDGSDEANCSKKSCGLGFFECSSGECVELRRRCDARADCRDRSDERACRDPTDLLLEVKEECAPWEYTCELNQTICLPLNARCNGVVECPGDTDELGCDFCQKYGQFLCKADQRCITWIHVCDRRPDCTDAADETAEACEFANSRIPSAHHYGSQGGDCSGYRCAHGECLELEQLCDGTRDCYDDEGGLCSTPCDNSTCKHICHSTPRGPQCFCHPGYTLAEDKQSCSDIDECMGDVCPQYCHNAMGTFVCSCYRGYALRTDHRSCKAFSGNNQMSVLYVSGNSVRGLTTDGRSDLYYKDPTVTITDLTGNIRKKKLYITAASSGKLIEVNDTKSSVVVTNIGKPTKVSIDWVTGNIYFVDSTPGNSFIRVCNVAKRRCARLQRIPNGHEVTAISVDPSSNLLFYCVTRALRSTVTSSSTSGRHIRDVTAANNCTGLVADSFLKRLYVAESTSFTRVAYDGTDRRTIISNVPNFESPIGLALFEDYIYFLVANSFKFNRCLLFGKKHCEPYYWRLFDANTFFLHHESTQRDDLQDGCEDFECSNICVGGDDGPECVCVDGSLAANGKCDTANPSEVAVFHGWSQSDLERASRVSWSLIVTVCVMLVLYAVFFVYYHYYYKRRIDNSYMDVRFQNTQTVEGSMAQSIDIATAGRSSGREFSNPLQMIRDTWHASFKNKRPIGTASLTIDIPALQQQDLSDTESDLDERETKSIVHQRLP